MRGWLHAREGRRPWMIDRIATVMGRRQWLSHRDESFGTDGLRKDSTLTAVAGFWPTGGFVELVMRRDSALEDHPSGYLTVYAKDPDIAERVFCDLSRHYMYRGSSSDARPRIGLLNEKYNELEVQKVPVADDQVVSRETAHLYYGDGVLPWIDGWTSSLASRRYGLTVLTGQPGTGKTTLIRSLARWMAKTHMFYFMPASRFMAVDTGQVVSFWAEENQSSSLRKVLILEDAESVLMRRSGANREHVASLLNLTDGMMGDALGLQVVCTLNCELSDLDPALLRPGRLLASRDFGPLSIAEAERLRSHLKAEGPPIEAPKTLAELMNPGPAPVEARPRKRTVGFHADMTQ